MSGNKFFSVVVGLPLLFALSLENKSCQSTKGNHTVPTAAKKNMNKLKTGTWGGDHIGVEVSDGGATFDYDCAHGSVERVLTLDESGNFEATGFHVKEHFGPVHASDDTKGQPARYVGHVEGDTMTVAVTLTDTKEMVGTFTLKYGKPPRVFKCG